MHYHTAEQCPAVRGKDAVVKYYGDLSEEAGKKYGVKVLGSYTAPAEHAQFMIVKAKDYNSLTKFLTPLEIGTTRITPVATMEERRKMLQES